MEIDTEMRREKTRFQSICIDYKFSRDQARSLAREGFFRKNGPIITLCCFFCHLEIPYKEILRSSATQSHYEQNCPYLMGNSVGNVLMEEEEYIQPSELITPITPTIEEQLQRQRNYWQSTPQIRQPLTRIASSSSSSSSSSEDEDDEPNNAANSSIVPIVNNTPQNMEGVNDEPNNAANSSVFSNVDNLLRQMNNEDFMCIFQNAFMSLRNQLENVQLPSTSDPNVIMPIATELAVTNLADAIRTHANGYDQVVPDANTTNNTDTINTVAVIDQTLLQREVSEVLNKFNIFKKKEFDNPFYKIFQYRLNTFTNNWPELIVMDVAKMARAGFYYTTITDKCKCFCCGGGLHKWKLTDDPYTEHAFFFPKCPYIRQATSESFVESVRTNRDLTWIEDDMDDGNNSNNSTTTTNTNTCKICMTNKSRIILFPCGHTCCVTCYPPLLDCPFCRKHIDATGRVFF